MTSISSVPRSTWLWDTALITDPIKSGEILRFCKAHEITTLYLQIDVHLERKAYRTFITACTLSDVKVEALDGDPSWCVEPWGVSIFLDWIEEYMDEAVEFEKFKGIHVDIEPWQLPDWHTSKLENLRAGWQRCIEVVCHAAKNTSLTAAADIPFWLHEIGPGYTFAKEGMVNLQEYMILRLDYVVIMAYRNEVEGVLDVAQNALRLAKEKNVPVALAVETRKSEEGGHISYYGRKQHELEVALRVLGARAKSACPAFKGIAVHDYIGWKAITDSANQATQPG